MTDYDSPLFESDDERSEAISSLATEASPEDYVPPQPELPPGPGFLESIAWTFSALILHIIGGVVAVIALTLLFLSEQGWDAEKLQQLIKDKHMLAGYFNSKPAVLIGFEMATFVVGVLLLTLLRLGKDRRRAIPISRPMGWHIVLTMLWVLPLSMLCSQIGVFAAIGWDQVTQAIPSLRGLDKMNIMESIGDIISGMPRWQVYLWIAVAPAVGEEFLFRVLIGRGLVARYGIVAGIAFTTFFFAVVHFHPVHMVALIPLSIAIHLSYLASKTIWIPMLAHFLNNAWAVTILLAASAQEAEPTPAEAMGDGFFPWWLTVSSLLVSVCIGGVYWKSRIRLLPQDDSTEGPIQEPFVSADRSLSPLTDRLGWQSPPFEYYVALVVTLLFFGISLAVHLQRSFANAA